MQGGEYLAQGVQSEFSKLKISTLKRYETNKLHRDNLEFILEEAFRLGHYAGHLRGELHVHNLYTKVYGNQNE